MTTIESNPMDRTSDMSITDRQVDGRNSNNTAAAVT